MSQDLATVAGLNYRLDFVLAADPAVLQDSAASMTVSFGGQPAAAITSAGFQPGLYQAFSYDVLAASSTSTLLFGAFTTGDAGNWFLDSVSVDVAAIPEPPTGGTIGAALLVLVLARSSAGRAKVGRHSRG